MNKPFNKIQRYIIGIGITIIFFMGLFPPVITKKYVYHRHKRSHSKNPRYSKYKKFRKYHDSSGSSYKTSKTDKTDKHKYSDKRRKISTRKYYHRSRRKVLGHQYAFLFKLPKHYYRLDIEKLAVQWLLILFLTALLAYHFRKFKKKDESEPVADNAEDNDSKPESASDED